MQVVVAWHNGAAVSCSLPCALGDAASVQECAGPAGGDSVPADLPYLACRRSAGVSLSLCWPSCLPTCIPTKPVWLH